MLQFLVNTYVTEHRWPNWRWLRKQIGQDAAGGEKLLRSLYATGIREGLHGREYGYLMMSDFRSGISLQNDATIALTMAGLWHGGAHALVGEYFALLAAAVRASQDFEPELGEVTHPRLSSSDAAALGDACAAIRTLPLYDMLYREPPFWPSWQSGPAPAGGAGWYFDLDDSVERYASVTSIEAYLQTVTAHVTQINQSLLQQIAARQPPTRPWPRRAAAASLGLLRVSTMDGIRTAISAAIAGATTALGTLGGSGHGTKFFDLQINWPDVKSHSQAIRTPGAPISHQRTDLRARNT